MAKSSSRLKIKLRIFFIQYLLFNKTIIPLTLVEYKLMIADAVLRTSSAI